MGKWYCETFELQRIGICEFTPCSFQNACKSYPFVKNSRLVRNWLTESVLVESSWHIQDLCQIYMFALYICQGGRDSVNFRHCASLQAIAKMSIANIYLRKSNVSSSVFFYIFLLFAIGYIL